MDEAAPLLALLAFVGFGGKKKKPTTTDPNKPHDCPAGQRWSQKHNRCIETKCPPGSVRNVQTGLCIQKDGPITEPDHDDDNIPPKNWPTDNDVDDYPTDGKLFKVGLGWIWGGTGTKRILANSIAQAGYRAKINAGASKADALAFATQVSHDGDNRSAYFAAIHRDPWNDGGYGTYGYSGQEIADLCTHRAIRLIPQNDNVLAKLASNTTPTRYMQIKKPNDAHQGNAYGKAGGKLPVIYMPKIDDEYLLATGKVRTTNTLPAWIRDLGWYNLPAGVQWGC